MLATLSNKSSLHLQVLLGELFCCFPCMLTLDIQSIENFVVDIIHVRKKEKRKLVV